MCKCPSLFLRQGEQQQQRHQNKQKQILAVPVGGFTVIGAKRHTEV